MNENIKKIKILDCTLRDGGYYNNWSFEKSLVQRYLHAMELCKIDFVELGFRSITLDESTGNFGKTSEDLLNKMDLPSSMRYAVMLTVKSMLKIITKLKILIQIFAG